MTFVEKGGTKVDTFKGSILEFMLVVWPYEWETSTVEGLSAV